MDEQPTVLLMRPQGEGMGVFEAYARTIYVPIVAVKPIPNGIKRLGELLNWAEWLVVTSPRGAQLIASQLKRGKMPRIAAVGPVTARILEQHGIHVDLVPENYRGAELARQLLAHKPRRVLMARSEKANPEPTRVLREEGVEVVEVHIYTLEPDEKMALIAAKVASMVDYVAFTSPLISTIFTKALRREGFSPANPPFKPAAIGPTTARKLLELGYKSILTSREYTLEGLARTILEDWKKKQNPTTPHSETWQPG